MKTVTRIAAFLLAAVMLCCVPVVGTTAEPSYSLTESGYHLRVNSLTAPCKGAMAYAEATAKAALDLTLIHSEKGEPAIIFSLVRNAKDYEVTFDESTGNVTVTGGSEAALKRGWDAFLRTVTEGDGTGKYAVTSGVNCAYCYETDKLDNSGLLTYRDSGSTTLLPSYSDGILKTPDWVDSLVMVELRPDTASIGGTLPESCDLLDYYASLGVNGIWLAPVYRRGENGNGYGNLGPHTVDPAFSGKETDAEGWQVVANFVKYAHSKGIYVFLDVITWGVMRNAPLIEEHPDWFNGEAWGNIAFDWSNEELYRWYVDTLVNNIRVTDADGFRCDCEPHHSGYDMYGEVKKTLAAEGKYIIIISEDGSTRSGVYDFEQDGVLDYSTWSREKLYQHPTNFFGDGILNIVESVQKGVGLGYEPWQKNTTRRGTGKYYTNCITNHDYQARNVCGSRVKIGYSAILAPFIPIWYMGDEFNARCPAGVQYDMRVNYEDAEIPENAFFTEDVKQMLRIRRTYTDLFAYWPANHRHSNICEVQVTGLEGLPAYARFGGNRAALVVAGCSETAVTGQVTVPLKACGLQYYEKFTVTNLMTGQVIKTGTADEIRQFTAYVPYEQVGVYLVEGSGVTNSLLLAVSGFFRTLPERVNSLRLRILDWFDTLFA